MAEFNMYEEDRFFDYTYDKVVGYYNCDELNVNTMAEYIKSRQFNHHIYGRYNNVGSIDDENIMTRKRKTAKWLLDRAALYEANKKWEEIFFPKDKEKTA